MEFVKLIVGRLIPIYWQTSHIHIDNFYSKASFDTNVEQLWKQLEYLVYKRPHLQLKILYRYKQWEEFTWISVFCNTSRYREKDEAREERNK